MVQFVTESRKADEYRTSKTTSIDDDESRDVSFVSAESRRTRLGKLSKPNVVPKSFLGKPLLRRVTVLLGAARKQRINTGNKFALNVAKNRSNARLKINSGENSETNFVNGLWLSHWLRLGLPFWSSLIIALASA